MLQRRHSDEVGATGVISADKHEELKALQRPKARPTFSGKTFLTPSKHGSAAASAGASKDEAELCKVKYVWHEGQLCKEIVGQYGNVGMQRALQTLW